MFPIKEGRLVLSGRGVRTWEDVGGEGLSSLQRPSILCDLIQCRHVSVFIMMRPPSVVELGICNMDSRDDGYLL